MSPIQVALEAAALAYWKLEETSGTRIDSSGRGNDLTDNATAGSRAGILGTAVDLIRVNAEYLSRADNADLSSPASLDGWALLDLTSYPHVIVGKWNAVATSREYVLYVEGPTPVQLTFYVNNTAGTDVQAIASGIPPGGAWFYWYVEDSGANIGVEFNRGTLVQTAFTDGIRDGTNEFRLGLDHTVLNYWDGGLDEVGVYNRVLTAAEKDYRYNGGVGRTLF